MELYTQLFTVGKGYFKNRCDRLFIARTIDTDLTTNYVDRQRQAILKVLQDEYKANPAAFTEEPKHDWINYKSRFTGHEPITRIELDPDNFDDTSVE